MNKKIILFKRKRGTFMWWILNRNTNKIDNAYIQFSLKDPWWIPKYNPNFLNGKCPLFGWLFFYFGKTEIGELIDGKFTLYDKYNKQKVGEKY